MSMTESSNAADESSQVASNHSLLFVYGTLKSGEPNHHILVNRCPGFVRFIGYAKTVQKYPLVIATDNNIPFLLHVPGKGNNVHGEIYEVCNVAISFLDTFEDHPSWYLRMTEDVIENKSGNTKKCFVYFLPNPTKEWLEKPMIDSYKNDVLTSSGLGYKRDYLDDEF